MEENTAPVEEKKESETIINPENNLSAENLLTESAPVVEEKKEPETIINPENKPEEKPLTESERAEKKAEIVESLLNPAVLLFILTFAISRLFVIIIKMTGYGKPTLSQFEFTEEEQENFSFLIGETIKEEKITDIKAKYVLGFSLLMGYGYKFYEFSETRNQAEQKKEENKPKPKSVFSKKKHAGRPHGSKTKFRKVPIEDANVINDNEK